MPITLKGAELRALCAKLRSYLVVSDDEHEIAKQLGLSWEDYEDLKRRFYELEEQTLRKRTDEQWFIDYLAKQQRNQEDLTRMIELFENSKQYNAMIGAVRARADINDKIVERAQEFGFVSKEPDKKLVAHGHFVADGLSTAEIKGKLAEALGASKALLERYGDERSIIDVTPPKIHRDEHLTPPKPLSLPAPASSHASEQRPQHARNRVHKGRRVVKSKA